MKNEDIDKSDIKLQLSEQQLSFLYIFELSYLVAFQIVIAFENVNIDIVSRSKDGAKAISACGQAEPGMERSTLRLANNSLYRLSHSHLNMSQAF